jgi:hypothetical protein
MVYKMTTYADYGGVTYPDMQIAQGWQCPICKSVMAPTMMFCIRCPQKIVTNTTGTSK